MTELKALEGIKIMDLTRVLAGPFCTMVLADLGAEVIKVEVPATGDDSRTFPPFKGDESAYFINFNRNKKSIVLDLKKDGDREKFLRIVGHMDVLVENFRPDTMEKIGLGFEELQKVNKKLIYASISGFGHYGPYKYKPGYDIIGQAMGGIMSITGWPDSPPTRTGTGIADILAGLFCCVGILSAIHARNLYGLGQKVDISITDSVIASMGTIFQKYLVEKKVPERTGNTYEFIAPCDSFRAKDGWFIIAVGNDKLWKDFCRAINREDLIADKRFENNLKRIENRDALKATIEEWSTSYTRNEIVEVLESNQVPAAPIMSVDQIAQDQHFVVAREMIQEVAHPIVGKTKICGSPIKMSVTNPSIRTASPLLGEHTEEIFREYAHRRKKKG
jgi:crotonobetainyl-CoA:carnitine CoA-transferase CaiB-like acyl-CoA transferase